MPTSVNEFCNVIKYVIEENLPQISYCRSYCEQSNYPKWFSFKSRKLLRNKKLAHKV